jgi:large subunit ribosomal protein L30
MAGKPGKTLKVTLARSLNRRTERHRACVAGLGLRRVGHTVEVPDTPEVRGMIRRVSYLLKVTE